jgi:hypothetical protein
MCQRRWGRPGRRSHGRPRPLEAVAPHALRIRRFRARTWSASGVAWYVTGQLAQSSVSGPSRNGRGTLVEGFPTRAELGTATAQLELVQSLDGGRRPARQSTATWNHFAGGGIQPRGSRSEGNTAVSGGGAAMKFPSHLAPRRHTAGAAVTTNSATGHNAGSRPSPSEETPSSGQPLPCTAEGRLLRAFVQKSVRLDMDKLETQCARWLGHPLEQQLRFVLRPFRDDLERIWRRTLSYVWSNDERGLPLVGAARAALDEFLITLLLHRHPHNYSAQLAETVPAPVPGLVRRAERFMVDNATRRASDGRNWRRRRPSKPRKRPCGRRG